MVLGLLQPIRTVHNLYTCLFSMHGHLAVVVQDGRTPLHWAGWSGNLAVMQTLLVARAPITAKDKVRLIFGGAHASVAYPLSLFCLNMRLEWSRTCLCARACVT